MRKKLVKNALVLSAGILIGLQQQVIAQTNYKQSRSNHRTIDDHCNEQEHTRKNVDWVASICLSGI